MTPIIMVTPQQFFECIDLYLNDQDRQRVHDAFEFARRKHGNQRRKSGELFFTHPLTVAYYLAEYRLDAAAISAALLHDVAEDTDVSISTIKKCFGSEVSQIVDGVTKLKNVSKEFSRGRQLSSEEIQDLSTQKMLREMTANVRVVLVKLFDRLHNIRTIEHVPPHKQRQKARETLAVYAPLANRLGIWHLKNELEWRSLKVLDPAAFETINDNLEALRKNQESQFQTISGQIFDHFLEAILDVRNIVLAPENIYTVYQDLNANGTPFSGLDKTLRLVVLMDDWISCYTALGHLHQLWRVVPNHFDDYISVPRDNLYRSLHTTVVHSDGQQLKIRLRTVAMDKVSKIGVLARWLYVDTPLWDAGVAKQVTTLFSSIKENINADYRDAGEAVKGVLGDQLGKQINVYTPRGDTIQLVEGATALDFAYVIHTGLGDQCQAAYVNDALYPLNKALRNGHQVHVVKGVNAAPQRAWLDEDLGYLQTSYARSYASRWFRRLPYDTAVAQGKELLQAELQMLGLPHYPHKSLANSFDFKSKKELYHALGRAELLGTVVATRVLDEKWAEEPVRDLENVVIAPSGEKYLITRAYGRKLRLCAACEPHPRDSIVGYLRKNGVLTVHKENCRSLSSNRPDNRLLKLGWGVATPRKARLLSIEVDIFDRPGMLYDITKLMHVEDINITYIHTPPTAENGVVRLELNLEVEHPRQAVRILHRVQALVNVYSVYCVPTKRLRAADSVDTSFYQPE